MTFIASGQDTPAFYSVSKKTKKSTKHYVAAWDIDGNSVKPVLYPVLQKDSVLLVQENRYVVNPSTGEQYDTIASAAESVGQ